MALQRPLKGAPYARFLLIWGVWKVLTSRPDSFGVRNAIGKPFSNGVLQYPMYPSLKGRLHTTMFYGVTVFSEASWGIRNVIIKPVDDGVLLYPICSPPKGYLHMSTPYGATELLGVRHAIMKPFYDGVLRHPICPAPKGYPHTSIFHGATESSEGRVHRLGVFGYLESADFEAIFWKC
ncbi:hypothetical protein B9Z19DRAFT_1137656 [Tuber borchii]|uniref:Uncharacterized protein n=1 Tax=Tuber borchii TaxID=42251 RepID=A0A2T6ZAC4_TUBBO|nr:hypothetical protein B9Z19DRAFT_1137656 [Tuber borchii]